MILMARLLVITYPLPPEPVLLVPILTSVVSVAHRFNTTLTEKKNGANKIKDLKLVPDLLPLPLVSTPVSTHSGLKIPSPNELPL